MSPGAASVLMTGKLTEIQGEFNVDEAVPEAPQNNSNSKYMTFQEQPAPIDFLQDDRSEMTFARRIALTLMNSKWYNPKAGEQIEQEKASTDEPTADEDNLFEKVNTDPPSLEKAWAYFEHVSLDRYIVEDKPKTKKNICRRIVRKFQKGDKKTRKGGTWRERCQDSVVFSNFHSSRSTWGLWSGNRALFFDSAGDHCCDGHSWSDKCLQYPLLRK